MLHNSQYYPILTDGLTKPSLSEVQSLVSNLLDVLPKPLTIQYSNNDIISQYLAHDLVQFNQLLHYNHCSLKRLATLLNGDRDGIDEEQLQLLHDIVTNKVPSCWPNPLNSLPVTMDLTTYVDLVERKALFHQQWPSTNTIDLALFSQIPTLLDSLKVQYCCDNGLQAEEAYLSCQVSYHPSLITVTVTYHYSYYLITMMIQLLEKVSR